MTAFVLVTPPAVEPVTLSELKAQARIDTAAEDTLASGLIAAARQWIERYTGRAFIAQTWQMWIDNWEELSEVDYIELLHPPLINVNSVKVFDNNDESEIWASENYFVDTAREPGRLALRAGSVWPIPERLTNGLMIEYDAGYGETANAVPEAIKLAIKQLATCWYEHRGDEPTGIPQVVQALIHPFRIQNMRA